MQSGVIRATSIEELFVFASAFASQPVPSGPNVAIVTNSGGPGILATDACIQLGLSIPALGEDTQQAIRAVVAPEASVANPVDMIATATGPQYEAVIGAVARDPAVHALIAIFTSLEMIDGPSVAHGIVRGAAGAGKPVLVIAEGVGKVAQQGAEFVRGLADHALGVDRRERRRGPAWRGGGASGGGAGLGLRGVHLRQLLPS